jgi:hypothetical protein
MARTGALIIASSLPERESRLPEVPKRGAAKGVVDLMQSRWFARLFFALVAVLAASGILGGTACTRWGQPGPALPSLAPLSALYVDPVAGSDATGNGSMTKPYRTLTKAVAVFTAAKVLAPNGVIIHLNSGTYDAANGEQFPIVVTKTVSIDGTNFGHGPMSGSFINGVGEDTIFEKIVGAPAHTAYTTLEVAPPATLSVQNIYVGATKISLGAKAFYASVDVLASLTGQDSSFAAGIVSAFKNVDGVLVAGGTFNCTSCQIHGNDFGIGGVSVPLVTASPYAAAPSITLSRAVGDSFVAAKLIDVATDGSVDVVASDEKFQRAAYAFTDVLSPFIASTTRGAIDFGGGFSGSPGGNNFIGARKTEIFLTRRSETVSALDDTWNPRQQGATRGGNYTRARTFSAGAAGKNVTIRQNAVGTTVMVGPAIVPTPTPSSSPSPSPTPTQ